MNKTMLTFSSGFFRRIEGKVSRENKELCHRGLRLGPLSSGCATRSFESSDEGGCATGSYEAMTSVWPRLYWAINYDQPTKKYPARQWRLNCEEDTDT